jgi:hypothetical protein
VSSCSSLSRPPALRWARRLVALVLFLVFTGVPTFYFYRGMLPQTPEPMTKVFNVAVTEYGLVESAVSAAQASKDAKWLSDTVFDKLEDRFQKRFQKDDVDDLAGDVGLGHENIRFVEGASPEERELAVAELAREINADIVIYGNIDTSQSPPHLVPKFYISPRLTGAEENTGRNTFGAPIPV